MAVPASPVPLKLAVWGLPEALSETLSVPVRVPAAAGEKVTLILQLLPALRDAPQLFVCAKSPLAEMPEMARAAVPLLERVTGCEALVVPKAWGPKFKLVTESLAEGVGVGGAPLLPPPHPS